MASWNLWQPCRLVVAPGVCFLSYLLSGSGTWDLLCTWYLDLTTWHRAGLALGTAAAALPPLGIPTASCLHLPDCRQLRAFCSIMLCLCSAALRAFRFIGSLHYVASINYAPGVLCPCATVHYLGTAVACRLEYLVCFSCWRFYY